MSEQEKVVEGEVGEKEEQQEGKVEISASISASGKFNFSATEGVHPMFLVGLLQFAMNTVLDTESQDIDE